MIDSETKTKKIPYGLSDYSLIRKENYYYVDKTRYLIKIEKAGRYLFFIRPRRFGKSLFLSMMEGYYDIYYKDRFQELFKGTAIFKNPTEEQGTYLILAFNFSMVDPALDKVEKSFLEHVKGEVNSFIRKYDKYLLPEREEYIQSIKTCSSAADILSALIRLCKDSQQKIYAFIDEYDNFSNTFLSTVGNDAYHDLTRGEGFFRSFFNILKGGTGRMEAPFSRLFMTGVSPITIDDVTSGYNIGENISLDADLNHMLGFTGNEVNEILKYYKTAGWIEHQPEMLLEIMEEWYGNYLFSEYAIGRERLFNADMVLYFLKQYFKNRSIPGDLIDRNVRIDYGKLRHLIVMDEDGSKTTNGNFSQLKEIIEKGSVSTVIAKGFPLEKLTDPNHFKSLLFYFGLLTIDNVEKDKLRLVIPNETAKRLYYNYISEAYRETGTFDFNLSKYSELMTDLAYEGKWRPLFEFISARMQESLSLRDLITGEKSIQAFLNVYLGLSQLYIIHPEKESNKGFADIVMEPFLARYSGMKYAYILELKYLKTKDTDAKLEATIKAAQEQLKQYSLDGKLKKQLGKTKLVRLVLVFSGTKLKHIDTV